MFGWLRNLTLTETDRRQEAISAYLDGQLSPAARQRFETELAADPRLRKEVARLQQMRVVLRQLPRRAVPRNFTLNPATYERRRPTPAVRLYPIMRAATALASFFFLLSLALLLARPSAQQTALAPANDTQAAQEAPAGLQVTSQPEIMAEESAPEAAAPEETLRSSSVGLSGTQTITITANEAFTQTIAPESEGAGILGIAPTEPDSEEEGEALETADSSPPPTAAPTPTPRPDEDVSPAPTPIPSPTPTEASQPASRLYLAGAAGALTLTLAAITLYLRQRR